MADIITIDIGNSNIVIGLWTDKELKKTWRINTKKGYYIAPELEALFEDVFNGITISETTGAIISSVVPDITVATSDAIEYFIQKKPLIMGPFLDTGIDISNYDGPRLGVDRIVDLAATRSFNSPIMVCDLGTCTTITVADLDGKVIGGMICAGVQLSLDAQAERASQLPRLKASKVDNILGLDTTSNMLSGAVAGTGIMINGIYNKLIEENDALTGMKLVITGGLGEYVMPWIENKAIYEPNLLLKGLLEIYEINKYRLN